jgi:hypothetical protein
MLLGCQDAPSSIDSSRNAPPRASHLILYIPPGPLFTHLLQRSLEALEDLKLNLGLGNVSLAAAAVGNLLGLGDLVLDGLGAEVLQSVTLNGVDAELGVGLDSSESARQEELLVGAGLLDDLNKTRLQLLDGSNVVGEDTHLTGLGGKVDLDDILGLVDGLVRKGQGELDLVGGDLGVTATLDGAGDGSGPRAEGGTGETEGAHGGS